MKNLLLTGAILFASTTIFAQTNTFPSSGNVGIGTLSPAQKLHVVGGIQVGGDPGLVLGNSTLGFPGSGTVYNFITRSAGSGGTFPWNVNGTMVFQSESLSGSGGFVFATGTTPSVKMVVEGNGNIGIGTTTPYSKLTVQGDVKLSDYSGSYGIYYANISETHGGQSTIIGNNIKAGTGYNSVVRYASSADNGSFINLSYSRGITFHVGVNSLLNTETDAWNYEAMRITQGGNIGIGTSAPAEKLAVNGKIRAKEIKVETSGWPDFVFQPGYKLRSLSATEQFIKTNGHLPEIPSAAVVEKEGVELGEMNRKLLQKVEELTLHLIRLEKEIKKLKTNH